MLDPKIKLLELHNHKIYDKEIYLIKKINKCYERILKIKNKLFECKHCKKIIIKRKEAYLNKEYIKLDKLKQNEEKLSCIDGTMYADFGFFASMRKKSYEEVYQQSNKIMGIKLSMCYVDEIKDKLCLRCKKKFNKLSRIVNIYNKYFLWWDLLQKHDKELNKK